MSGVLNILKKILLLAWLVFLVLCAHSCLMASDQDAVSADSGAEAAVPAVQAQPGGQPGQAAPVPAVSESTPAPEPAADTVALSSGSYEKDLAALTAVVTPEDLALLDSFTALKSADFTGSTCYAQLADWVRQHPDVAVTYTVSLPDGQTVDSKTDTLDLSSLSSSQVSGTADALRGLPSLGTIRLGSEEGGLSWNDVALLHDAAPDAALDYACSVWGVNFNLSDTDLSFSHIKMDDEGAAVKQVLPYMKNLRTLDMDFCGVSDSAMAGIRSDFPAVDVIWRVWFAGYSVRTDVERILASSQALGGRISDEDAKVLQYCTKVKLLDLGHNQILTDISFVRNMPDLEVAIFAINNISDASPLAECTKLEYLEINSTNITDLTPLANLTGLHHLNIGRCVNNGENDGSDEKRPRVTDISPLFGLTELERLYIGSLTAPGIPKEQLETMAEVMHVEKIDSEGDYCDSKVSPEGLPYDYCRINLSSGDPSQGAWRTAGYRPNWVWAVWAETGVAPDVLNDRYKLLREQFGYDNADQNQSLPQNDPLY